MTIDVDVQRACDNNFVPCDASIQAWVEAVLGSDSCKILTIRAVDYAESADLNLRFRCREGPTNVLSFSADLPPEIDTPLLGDIVICAPLAAAEAVAQGKDPQAHWAHLIIHGVLHLLGFDHQSGAEARKMESREISLLESLGFSNPYA